MKVQAVPNIWITSLHLVTFECSKANTPFESADDQNLLSVWQKLPTFYSSCHNLTAWVHDHSLCCCTHWGCCRPFRNWLSCVEEEVHLSPVSLRWYLSFHSTLGNKVIYCCHGMELRQTSPDGLSFDSSEIVPVRQLGELSLCHDWWHPYAAGSFQTCAGPMASIEAAAHAMKSQFPWCRCCIVCGC